MRGLFFVLLCCCVFVGCDNAKADTNFETLAGASFVLTDYTTTDFVPDDGERRLCTNCGGDGEVGDGRIPMECVPCEGTGWIVPKRNTVQMVNAVRSSPPVQQPAPAYRSAPQQYCGPNGCPPAASSSIQPTYRTVYTTSNYRSAPRVFRGRLFRGFCCR